MKSSRFGDSTSDAVILAVVPKRLEPLMSAELHVGALRRDASAAQTAQQGLRFLKPDLEIGLVSVGRPRVDPLSRFTFFFLLIT